MVGYLQPLAHNFAIVNELGYPTEYFIRWAQQKQIDIGESVDEGRALEIIKTFLTEHPLQAGSGISLTPDGDLNNSPTISAKAQEILDQITTTRGSILFRGASGWEALPPGTTTQYLKSGGPSADPLWGTPSGGGGEGFGLVTRTSGGFFTVPSTGGAFQSITPFNNIDYDPLGFFPSSASEIRFPSDGWYQIIFTAQGDGSDPFASNLFRFFASNGVIIYVASQVGAAGYSNPGILLDTGAFFAPAGTTAQLNAATSATGVFVQNSCRMTVKKLA